MRFLPRILPWLAIATAACGAGKTTEGNADRAAQSTSPRVQPTPLDPIAAGQRALAASRYAEAEEAFRSVGNKPEALLGLAQVALMTGRYDEAFEVAGGVREGNLLGDAIALKGESLRRRGRLEEAERVLKEHASRPEGKRARLLLGEVLLEQGRDAEAEPLLMRFIEDYNADRFSSDRATDLGFVGRAAQLLRSAQDANDAFNEAEKEGNQSADVLLWRAELFLDNYDEGHAEEVLSELLGRAPDHPEALVWMAQVKLSQNLDFEAAARLTRKALAVNPHLSNAYFVLAGIALRDLEFEEAEKSVAAGLATNPRDLPLLSMRAAILFLADDDAGFEGAKRAVLEKNPRYSEMYRIVGDYADWEHRYAEIVDLMREGLLANAADPKIRAQLGMNLIRLGDDAGGVAALRRAFDDDPFNVRAFNTLNLFEKTIPERYASEKYDRFLVRYEKQEKAVLERYVPALLDRAWTKMVEAYGFTPKTPIGIELYPEREHFAIRTSGLPQTYIQGVCFGQTLAAMTPGKEQFNFGMTLWHELAHVFHIQLSRSRVPRWFTEGLAEYETLVQRPEWSREHDLELFDALRLGRLPRVAAMNEAFSHARDMSDMATAYYGSAQIVTFIAERYGRQSLRKMLELWGAGKRTPEVVQTALGVSADELDKEFRAHVEKRLARYVRQFVPLGRPDDVEVARDRLFGKEKDPEALVRYAHALFAVDRETDGERALRKALELDPKQADGLWIAARRALEAGAHPEAERRLKALLAGGKDGYAVQMALARIARAKKSKGAVKKALEAAHAFDPTQVEPLAELVRIAREAKEKAVELDTLRKLAALEQHDPAVYRSLLRALLDAGKTEEAVEVGQAAVFVDLEGFETHELYGAALEATGKLDAAIFELESALLCPARPEQVSAVHRRLAGIWTRLGKPAKAQAHVEKAAAAPTTSQ